MDKGQQNGLKAAGYVRVSQERAARTVTVWERRKQTSGNMLITRAGNLLKYIRRTVSPATRRTDLHWTDFYRMLRISDLML